MTENDAPELKSEKKSRIDVFKKPGAARAVASSSWTILMAIIGAIMIFVFYIYAGNEYGEGGLSYYTVTGAIFALATAISAGSGGAFIKLAKEGYTENEERGKHLAVQMAKINLIIGLISNVALFVIAFLVMSDHLLFIMMFGAATAILISFMRDIFTNMFSIMNRFDMASIIGGLFGVVVFVYGFTLISFGFPAQWLAFGILVMVLIMLGISVFFYHRIKKQAGLGFKDLFLPSKKYPVERSFTIRYLKYGSLTTISNLVVFGIFSHIVLLMTFLTYNAWGSALSVPNEIAVLKMTTLLSLIDAFVFIEVAIIMFSGPLNVEIAEACVKKDQECIESSVNAIGRVAIILTIPFSVAMMVLAQPLLLLLAQGSVSDGGGVTQDLLFQGWVTFAITALGQAFYGLACIFGAALIGAGEAKKSALGFGIGALLLLFITPAFIFLFGALDNVLPAFGSSPYSLIGTGVAFLVSGIFVLPYLARATRKHLNIKYDLRIKRLIVCMLILGLFLFFAPYDAYALFLQNTLFTFLPLGILNIVSLLTFVLLAGLLCIISYCFFGVLGKGDGKLLQDTFDSFNLSWLARVLRKIGRFFYNLNPLNQK